MPLNAHQITKIHILSNVSKSKDNQTIKIGHLIEYSVRTIFFFQKSFREWGRETSFRPLFIKKNALYKLKTSGQRLNFNLFW